MYGFLNKIHFLARTGNRRFEFERLYLENPDPWNYHSSAYEREKYERTLACALKWRSASACALEVGCSVGAFSRMLAAHFDKVTAVDIAKQAIDAAVDHNKAEKNIRFVRGLLQSLDLDDQYDVIVCAEVLYYIREKDARLVCRKLDQHLAAKGIILVVTGVSDNRGNFFYFDGWEDILAAKFKEISKEVVQDPLRPYQIVVFSRPLSCRQPLTLN